MKQDTMTLDAFRKVFKKFTDLSPIDYRKKYAV